MKVAIIGCTHAGTAAIKELLRMDPQIHIDVYERNDNISFLSCGIALYLNNRVENLEDMMYAQAEGFPSERVQFYLQHDVLKVDSSKKDLLVQDLKDFSIRHESYDKLIMATGSAVTLPPLKGINHDRVMLCKNYEHAQLLHQSLKKDQKVALVGGGYVNVELAESLADIGCSVSLFQSHETVLNNYIDATISKQVTKLLTEHGVQVHLKTKVEAFIDHDEGLQVVTDTKATELFDLAIVSTGFMPVSDLLQGQVDLDRKGAIITNQYGQSSNPDIYAAGDVRTTHYNPKNTDEYIPLATNAIRQGTMVALNILNKSWSDMGTQGSTALELFGYTVATTGLTYQRAREAGIDADFNILEDNYRPEFMPSTTPITSIIVYDKVSLKILGAQFFSRHDVSQMANTVSLAIQNENTLKDLAFVDMLFQPYYDRPFNYLNLMAQAGLAKSGLI